jgi:hypothetical protein
LPCRLAFTTQCEAGTEDFVIVAIWITCTYFRDLRVVESHFCVREYRAKLRGGEGSEVVKLDGGDREVLGESKEAGIVGGGPWCAVFVDGGGSRCCGRCSSGS